MPKVLCIAYHFPPSSSVAGSLRSAEFARYLPSFGWEVTVLALRERSGEEQYADVIRVPSLLPWRRPFNLSPYGWLVPLLIIGWNRLRKRQHDVIYVSCPPFGFVPAVAWLKKTTGLPLVVDFRDAWTPGPYRASSRLEWFVTRYLFRPMERWLLRSADSLVVNTPSALRVYLKHYPWLAGRVHYIPNGYSEELFPKQAAVTRTDEFTVLHCGPFNVSGRDPMPLLAALRILQQEGRLVRLKILGDSGEGLKSQALSCGVVQQVDVLPPLSHQESLLLQQQCDALLLYQAPSSSDVTAVAGKTFEYIRSAKPILVIAPTGDNRRLVEHYAGYFVSAADHRPESIASCLRQLLEAWQAGSLPSVAQPRPGFDRFFERRMLTGRLASLFGSILRGDSPASG